MQIKLEMSCFCLRNGGGRFTLALASETLFFFFVRGRSIFKAGNHLDERAFGEVD